MVVFNNYLTKFLKFSGLALVNIEGLEKGKTEDGEDLKGEVLLLSVQGQEGVGIMEEVDDSRAQAQ